MPPSGKRPRKWPSQGPPAAVGERYLTAGLGWPLGRTWQRRRHLPSSAWTQRREVKQGKSGGSVGTADQGNGKGRNGVRPMGTAAYGGKGQGKGKGRGEGRLGHGGRGRSKGGEKPMGTTAYGGKGSKGRAANGDRPVGAASCTREQHTMASCQPPPPRCIGDGVFYTRSTGLRVPAKGAGFLHDGHVEMEYNHGSVRAVNRRCSTSFSIPSLDSPPPSPSILAIDVQLTSLGNSLRPPLLMEALFALTPQHEYHHIPQPKDSSGFSGYP